MNFWVLVCVKPFFIRCELLSFIHDVLDDNFQYFYHQRIEHQIIPFNCVLSGKLIKKSLSIDTSNKSDKCVGEISVLEENHVLILSEGMFHNIFGKDDKYYWNIFNNLSDGTIVCKLLRYHLYNENPEDGNNFQTFYFENPQLKYNDDGYMEEFVMISLNSGQTQELENVRYTD